ncbi:MAG: SH3 domain-containing protein [Rhodospirillales bacterium]|nr:SH3 domain-containing protein [Rhodospirillales bacterium]MCW8862044.1 SH3 domain-containing protein [Rhodospirillales bacterium]MCW8970467.1 SH3 domain-containing protein [Rhodospirillales bacterium]MCW9002964.1 SH3 domain-containing protein [Rhodospirillales bacterium]MCW9040664.1 SH3 domain-containing protein [Rhodospirillales bacterium]
MKKATIAAATCVALSGCAVLPVPFQIAMLAADGISYLESKKSLSDHGLSMVTGKDCAMWRILPEGQPCRDTENSSALASAEDAGQANEMSLTFVIETAHMRSHPSDESSIIRPLRVDEVAERLDETDGWVRVRIYDDVHHTVEEGWVNRTSIQDVTG